MCLQQNSSNTTLRFEPGCTIQAKRGSFHGSGDQLLYANGVSNLTIIGHGATLRMHRTDYANASLYAHSEDRMGMSFYSSQGLSIEGISVEESGGDGILLDSVANVHIKNVSLVKNFRQGEQRLFNQFFKRGR